MKKWKRITAGILSALLMVQILPQEVLAAEVTEAVKALQMEEMPSAGAYDSPRSQLWVNGKYMVRYGKLQTTTLAGDRGTATYNEATNTLTLKDFYASQNPGIGIEGMSGIKIVLKGTNVFNCQTGGIRAEKTESMTICGDGILKMTSGNSKQFGYGIIAKGDLNIQDCTMDIQATTDSIVSCGKLSIRNARLKLKRNGVDSAHSPGMTYDKRIRYGAMGAGELQVTASTLDICGINYAMGIMGLGGKVENLQPPKKPVLGSDMMVTDADGTVLTKLAKLHWKEDGEWTKRYEYVYSKTADGDINGFDEAANHIIMKPKPKPAEPPKEEETNPPKEEEKTPPKEETKNPPKEETKHPSNPSAENASKLYYKKSKNSKTVTCTGPVNRGITAVTIPSAVTIAGHKYPVTAVGKNAFKECKKLKTVTIGNSVKKIGDYAFYGCTSLRTVKMGSGVTGIGTKAFSKCGKLAKLTIGKNVSSIGDYAFYGCKSLTTVKLPSKLKKLNQRVFKNCTGLKGITIGEKTKSIGKEAFYGCTALSKVVMKSGKKGSGVISIGTKAFSRCGKLKKLTIGKNVSSIGTKAFYGCKNLSSLSLQGKKLKTIGKQAFQGSKNKIKVYVPKSKYSSYKKLLRGKGLKNPIYRKK